MPLKINQKISPSPNVLLQNLGTETVLLNLQTEEYFGLDDVGTGIWYALTENPSVQAAIDYLMAEYDVDFQQLQHDVEDLIEQLLAHELIEITTP